MRFLSLFKLLLFFAIPLMLISCSSMPSSGPTTSEVVRYAQNHEYDKSYLLLELDETSTKLLLNTKEEGFRGTFGDRRPPPSPKIGIGDSLSVTIWEAASGGLFSSPIVDKNSSGSRSASIPEQIVAKDASITVPYAGRIKVAGLTTLEVEQKIVGALKDKAIEPQVLVTIPQGLSNSVTILGEVTNSSKIPLSVRGERILDVIATAGGTRTPMHETVITLQRDGHSMAMPMQKLNINTQENIFVHPKDVITLIKEPQGVSIFGAAERNMFIPFEGIGMTLEQAIAKAGGISDTKADPKGVFLLRYESISFAKKLQPDFSSTTSVGNVPILYHLNLNDPLSYFLAQSVVLRNRDMIYIANSPVNQPQKILQLFTQTAQTVAVSAALKSAF